MSTRRVKRTETQQIRRYAAPFLFAFVTVYLCFHVLNGERGLYAYLKQSRNLEATRIELAELKAQREELENRVMLVSNDSLDLDMLDEQARRLLGFSKATERVVLLDSAGQN